MSSMEPTQTNNNFETLNRLRIERLSTLLPSKTYFFIDALPLLFQLNTESLPGFIDNKSTPVGITDYQPDKVNIESAKALYSPFQYSQRSIHNPAIQGVYLISKHDLFNYHPDDPFELWLIYSPSLSDDEINLLQQKLDAVCEWANLSLNFKLHACLLSEDTLSEKIKTADLALFYRNSLHFAGRTPSWQLTSLEPSNNVHKKKAPLDFGILPSLSPNILIDATCEALSQVLDKGLERVLDLVYVFVQITQYPNVTWLSDLIQETINNEITESLLSDGNTLKLQFITDHAAKNNVLLAQQSFYLRACEPLSKTINNPITPWRRTFIKQQVTDWQWSDEQIKQRDQFVSHSHYRQSNEDSQRVNALIKETMHALTSFIKTHNATVDIAYLEKKFKQYFEFEENIIPLLPTSFIPKNTEEELYLSRDNINSDWLVNDKLVRLSASPLYQHPSLVNVLAWAVNNHVLSENTRLQVTDKTQRINISLVQDLIKQLFHKIPPAYSQSNTESKNSNNAEEMQQLVLFSNIEHQASSTLNQQGFELSSLQTDPLNYANNKQNLIVSIEGLILSSWGRWHYFIHLGTTALLEMMSTVLPWNSSLPLISTAHCWCPTENHGKRISDRISLAYTDVITHYLENKESGEYIISIGGKPYQLQWQHGIPEISSITHDPLFLQSFIKKEGRITATLFDQGLDKGNILNTLIKHHRSSSVSLFLLSHAQNIILYILDESGNIFKQKLQNTTQTTLISHYQQFLDTINIDTISFFQLKPVDKNNWDITPILLDEPSNKPAYLPVIINVDSFNKNAHCSIHCGSKVFSGTVNDPALFQQVKNLVLSLRKTGNSYPLYINQLIFTQSNTYQTQHYLRQKRLIESQLN